MKYRDYLHSNMLDLTTLPSGKVPQSALHISPEVKVKIHSPSKGFISPNLSYLSANITLWATCLDALYNQGREMGISRMKFVCPVSDVFLKMRCAAHQQGTFLSNSDKRA